MNNNLKFLALLVALLLFPIKEAFAQTLDHDRFSLSLGVFLTERDTDTRLDTTLGNGTDLDLEDDLGLDPSDNVFRLDGYLRLGLRHRIDFSAFDLSRSNSTQIQRVIDWGDESFAIDTVVNSEFDLAIYKAAYTYAFMHSRDGYVGASLGVYVADSSVSLSDASIGQAEVGDVTAPLPVVGIRGQRRLSDNWTLRASGEFFFIEIDDIEGSLVDLFIGVDYALFDQLSMGLGFNSVDLDVDASQSNFRGALSWRYEGAMLYLKGTF